MPSPKNKTKPKPRIAGSSPVACLAFLPRVIAAAREKGYALAVHGTLTRDYDFIAVPWIEDACPAEQLIEAIRAACGGFIINDPAAQVHDYTRRSPEPKPHGRIGCAIHLGRGPYIDLSVMPLNRPLAIEKQFLELSIAVWREIDRLTAGGAEYPGIPQGTSLRVMEKQAWERYRDEVLDKVRPPAGELSLGPTNET